MRGRAAVRGLVCVLLGLGVCACGASERELTWVMRQVSHVAESENEEWPCMNSATEYPDFAGTDAADALDAIVAKMLGRAFDPNDPPASVDELGERFVAEWSAAPAEFPGGPCTSGWHVTERVQVVRSDPRVISLRYDDDSYTGGAHGNRNRRYASFEPDTAWRLTLDDLFVSGYEAPLTRIAERRFRAVRSIPPEQTLSEASYWFDDDVFALNENFAVVDEGLVFHYDAYEIACYAFGPTELLLPREELTYLLRPQSPLAE